MENRNYNDWLSVYRHYASMGFSPPMLMLHPDLTLEQYATDQMQQRFPGNYVVEEFYDPKVQRFDLRLKFDSESDETWWMLKNG